MIGYIKPCKPEMLIKDYDIYKSVYCSVCRSMGKNFGIISRLALSYDATFLAVLDISLKNQYTGFKQGRCVVNPLKKCMYCLCDDESLCFSSSVSLIMLHYKLKDDIRDSKFLKRILSKFLNIVFFRSYKKAKKRYPQIEEIIKEYNSEQLKVEKSTEDSLDLSAKPTSETLSKIFMLMSYESAENELILSQLGFFMGRWIYLIDAFEDIDKDIKDNNYNPFNNIHMNNRKDLILYCNQVLNQTLSQAISAFNLLNIKSFNRILENIINLGMSQEQKRIFEKLENREC